MNRRGGDRPGEGPRSLSPIQTQEEYDWLKDMLAGLDEQFDLADMGHSEMARDFRRFIGSARQRVREWEREHGIE